MAIPPLLLLKLNWVIYSEGYFLFLFLLKPAKPTRPVPRRYSVGGRGTSPGGSLLPINLLLPSLLLAVSPTDVNLAANESPRIIADAAEMINDVL